MFIERELTEQVWHWLDKRKILIIKGSRQVGKTTLLKHIKDDLENAGKQVFYLAVDQELGNPIIANSRNLYKFLIDQFPRTNNKNKLYLFLDEFQYLDGAGLFLKTLFDQAGERMQIIVSGSSSLEITRNTEFLTGRKMEFYLNPLSYREFIFYKTRLKITKNLKLNNFKEVEEFYEVYKEALNRYLLEYFNFGGYPEVVITELPFDKIMILKELVRTYIEKDITAFLRLENIIAFNNLLKILCDQTGNLVNKSELSNTSNLSMDTVNKYLNVLAGTYVVDFVRPYFTNIRKELSKMSKVYVNDLGLRNVVLNKSFDDNYIYGNERENFIYNVLKDKYNKENIKFYRTLTKSEIDFVLKVPNMLIPIEVKSVNKKIREPRIMRSFQDDHASKRFGSRGLRGKSKKSIRQKSIIITNDFLAKESVVTDGAHHMKRDLFFIPTSLVPFVKF